MATEQYANNAETTLNGAINNSVTSVVVTTGSVFPSVGNFRVTVDDEIMLVTARSTNTLTVTRGAEGTTAASHADLAAITHVLTAAGLLAVPATNILETSGPTLLGVGAINDGEYFKRVGSTFVSVAKEDIVWNLIVNNDLSSLTGFTAQNGTWAVGSGVTKQTNTADTSFRLRYDTRLPHGGPIIVQCEIQIVGHAVANQIAGIGSHWIGTNSGGEALARLHNTGTTSTINNLDIELDDTSGKTTDTISVATDTWHTLRIISSGFAVSAYLNGTLVATAGNTISNNSNANYIVLQSRKTESWYRNLKVWVPNYPA